MSKRVGANNRKKSAARKGKKQKLIKKFLAKSVLVLLISGVAVALAAGGILGYSRISQKLDKSSFLQVKKVVVEGNVNLTSEKIISRCGIGEDAKLYQIKTGVIKAAIGADPWVRSVSVKRNLSGKVIVKVTERIPMALVNMSGIYQVDRDGVILPLSKGTTSSLPLISGLQDTLDGVGRRVIDPLQMKRLRGFLEQVEQTNPELMTRISQVDLSMSGRIRFIMQSSPTIIEIGNGNIERKLWCLKQLEDVFRQQASAPVRIDLCYHNLAYITQ